MSRINNPEEYLANLASVDQMLDRLSAAERAKSESETALADALARIEALQDENVTLKADNEKLFKDSFVAAVDADVLNNLVIANATLTDERDALNELVSTLTQDLVKAVEDADTIRSDFESLFENLSEAEKTNLTLTERVAGIKDALGIKGEAPTTVSDVVSDPETESETLVAEYKRLLGRDRAGARKFYAEHASLIGPKLSEAAGSRSGHKSPINPNSEPSEPEWAAFNTWLARRKTVNDKQTTLSTGERNRLAAEVRREYAANKQLYDRCFAARVK